MNETLRILGFESPAAGDHPRGCTVDPEAPSRPLVTREWLVTNGLGGYASGTVSGVITRRFHGALIAALPSPLGRTMMLNHLSEVLRLGGDRRIVLGGEARPDSPEIPIVQCVQFRLEYGLPVWRFEHGDVAIERRLMMPHRQNTTYITYSLLEGPPSVELELEPWVHFRPHEGPVSGPLEGDYALRMVGDRYEISADHEGALPPLRMQTRGCESKFHIEGKRIHEVRYHIEAARGYDASGSLYTPGFFRAELRRGKSVAFVASTEEWRTSCALDHEEVARLERDRRAKMLAKADPRARSGLAAELVLASDQFVITPAGRAEDSARANASGDEIRTVIAGYPWFTDWGRDTMISLEGLTLTTGRHEDAGFLLRTFAHYVKDGLIPNMFPEGNSGGLYHTADATMWFFHALDRFVAATGDRTTLRLLMPTLLDIVAHHMRGTRFGIGVDPEDGLLRQGAEGYQLTWMDAKVGDLVVTPRRGKAVEINALWYNALRLMQRWLREDMSDEPASRHFAEQADRARESFNRRFWYAEGGYLYDVIDGEDGDDAAFRPNQLFAIAMPNPVLERAHWEPVLQAARTKLLTPVGLRSLAPDHPDYKPRYFGDLRARDLAYHQGTVWAWLIGPFVDAWLRVYPDRKAEARGFLEGFTAAMDEAAVGTISEVFDAEAPYVPRGCHAQAWSVAEVLRLLVKTS
ncbi:MAG: amylo-alpha-1,6-glucosidase [Myxococcota bacterium]|nr:amylo-alpha-1,6-glucosidase [Myxococcota bacterium]